MKKIIRLTESDLTRIVRRIIKENEEEWISQSQDIEGESDFGKIEVPRYLANNPNFKKLVSFFKRNREEAEEMESKFDKSLNEDYDYFDYMDAQPEKISREEYWKRKLRLFGLSATFGAIMGMFMAGGPNADTVIKMALAMAAGTAVVSNTLVSTVGREKKKDYDMGDQEPITEMEDDDFSDLDNTLYDGLEDEEWGETDKGEERLIDLIYDARHILEDEFGYDFDEINHMSEMDIVDALYDGGMDELASKIEKLMKQEGLGVDLDEPYDSIGGHSVNDLKQAFAKTKGMDGELGEGWDDFTQKRRYPEDYKVEKYRKLPKDVFKSGHRIDREGTVLTKKHEDPFDEFESFDDEEYV